jgi:hypothetical protein
MQAQARRPIAVASDAECTGREQKALLLQSYCFSMIARPSTANTTPIMLPGCKSKHNWCYEKQHASMLSVNLDLHRSAAAAADC